METEDIIKQLLRPETYPEKVKNVELVTTYISVVFLTGKYAYKLKLPVKFSHLDFSTLEKRKHFCEEEFRLNKEISPEMYIGVVPITEQNGEVRVNGSGRTIDYAVKMVQMPQEKLMSRLLAAGKINRQIIEKVAEKAAELHSTAEASEKISAYGSFESIKQNWEENFEQVNADVGLVISEEDYSLINGYVYGFMEENKELFEKRVKEGRIRHCHGDLQSGNIFIVEEKIYLFDRIEFNLRIACCDVASEVAFFAMDLDFFKREDLSKIFVDMYVAITNDSEIRKLLSFYKCYRAYVRGKVNCFKHREKQVNEEEREMAVENARNYFKLAAVYAKQV